MRIYLSVLGMHWQASVKGAPAGSMELKIDEKEVILPVGTIDAELDERGYIFPGLGDAGDRAFGTSNNNGAA